MVDPVDLVGQDALKELDIQGGLDSLETQTCPATLLELILMPMILMRGSQDSKNNPHSLQGLHHNMVNM